MTAIIVAEKPSQARNFATALGGTRGSYKGTPYEITHLRGHLYELVKPDEMAVDGRAAKYKQWSLANLPWDPDELTWKRRPEKDASDTLRDVKAALGRGDELVVATDLDPSGEGDLLFWEVIDELGFNSGGKTFSRMEFTDEAPASIQKAFVKRRPITSMTDEGNYRKAEYRNRWDYMSQQWSRIATIAARESGTDAVLRQGRLKSAMVRLVGDQQKAYDDYVKHPFFQNRFRDENDVVYTNPDEPRFDTKGDVPQTYRACDVVVDGKQMKSTAPVRQLDLAGLASRLAGKVKSKDILSIYQKMYDQGVLSYPRTEDKTITPEQFKELEHNADKIARVVGVDPGLLTHREPRRTHVKPKGAHGANRPGPNVPASLDAVEAKFGPTGRLIYETLAKNSLAMLAPDYQYEQQKGHVADYPAFTGIANVPKVAGWKAVFDAGEDPDDNESAKGLGTHADPFCFEGANKRPEHPSMTWLMKQLEKHDVGTGATRTSTYADVTNARTKWPLLAEKGRRVYLAEAGRMSWLLLPGTHIGDLATTERVFAQMREIAEGITDAHTCLAGIADLVREDMQIMSENAETMRSELGLTKTEGGSVHQEQAEGHWSVTDEDVHFSRSFGGHRFSDEEVSLLLSGKEISFSATSKDGVVFDVYGRLAKLKYKDHAYVGFERLGFGRKDTNGELLPPSNWQGHTFTPKEQGALAAGRGVTADDFFSRRTQRSYTATVYFKAEHEGEDKKIIPDFPQRSDHPDSWCKREFSSAEITDLEAGKTLELDGFISKTGKTFSAVVSWDAAAKKIVPHFDEPPMSWCQVKFTSAQRKALAAGKSIDGKGFVSKKGKKFDAKLWWRDEGGRKKIVPEFV